MKEISYAVDQVIMRVSRSKYFFYLALSLLCVLTGYLLPNPVKFRWVVIGVVIFLLFVVTVRSIRKGIIAMLVFLPFAAFLRRTLYFVSPYVKFDPIHLITPALVFFIFIEILLFDKERLPQAIKGNSLVKFVIALLGLFVLQIFNPWQGSVLVGLGGILYYIVPMAWFFFALSFGNDQVVHRLMIAIVVIGAITAAYGLCQMTFGFLPFEKYWMETGGFASLRVAGFIRAFSTFSSPEEYSRYLQIGGVIAFGYSLARKSLRWFLAAVFIGFAVLMTGVRSSVFGFAFSISVILVIWRAKDLRRTFIRLILLASAFVIIMSLVSAPSSQSVYDSQSIFYTMGGHTVRGLINPLGETTFQSRLNLWKYLLTEIVPRNPVGYGLGSTSIAAGKFGGSEIGTEGYVFALFVNSGVIGGLLFFIICLKVLKKGIDLSVQSEGSRVLPSVILAVIAGLILNNVFGNSFVLYSVAPIGWFLIGWIAKQRRIR